MDLSRVETGLQFLDNHNTWSRDDVLGVVTEARIEDIEGVGPAVVVDVKMSAREDLDSVVQDLADGILGCISCQYLPTESTLVDREGQYPLLTHSKSELLEVSLVSVPADPQALVRSETPPKGKTMAGKPTGARAAAQRALAARTQKRAEDTPPADAALDEKAVEEIVNAVIDEVVPAVVDELAAAVADDAGEPESRAEDTMTEEEKKKKEEEEAAAAAAAGDTSSRSLIRSLVAKALGRSTTPAPKPSANLTALRSVAAKYGVGAEFDDMSKLGATEGELRSFVLNATAARSGTGQTHDGRNTNQRSSDSQLIRWDDTARAQRSVERNTRR
jgi:hypothetical protein